MLPCVLRSERNSCCSWGTIWKAWILKHSSPAGPLLSAFTACVASKFTWGTEINVPFVFFFVFVLNSFSVRADSLRKTLTESPAGISKRWTASVALLLSAWCDFCDMNGDERPTFILTARSKMFPFNIQPFKSRDFSARPPQQNNPFITTHIYIHCSSPVAVGMTEAKEEVRTAQTHLHFHPVDSCSSHIDLY